ncbi:hypothetical protein E2320_012825 [Naja naja]|nr:hypothetical protein E2320_012825 [Naja naja]
MGNAHAPRSSGQSTEMDQCRTHSEEFRVSAQPLVPPHFQKACTKPAREHLSPRFPALAEDAIPHFPETLLLTQYDIFRDNGLLYKKRLEENGVPVTWHHLKDGFHGICLLTSLGPLEFPSTRKSMKSIIRFLEWF